jgi:hypothetical protein
MVDRQAFIMVKTVVLVVEVPTITIRELELLGKVLLEVMVLGLL